jgi:enamine deaminase RidA (YjgF/YER057c/UK114 family)
LQYQPEHKEEQMNTNSMISRKLDISTFRLGQHTSANCITINDEADIPPDGVIRNEAEKLKAVILNQFIFADSSKYSASFKKLVAKGAPITCLNHTAPDSKGICSAQAITLSGIRNVETVKVNGRKIGLIYEDGCARYCFLSNVFAPNVNISRSKQTEIVFETFEKAMTQHEFEFTETVRTWFFNDHILDWYDEFNKVRTDFFDKTGIFENTVPASTGIGASNPYGAALIGNLFAVQPKDGRVKIQAVPSPMQESALNYKSSFSRAIELEFPTHRSLFISGTASIDKDGKTAFLDDAVSQIDLTMRVVAALLQSRKMDWKNLFRGIVYFKHPDYLKHFEEYCRKHKICSSKLAVAFTDRCRDDLLFEIELDAFIAKASVH